MPSTFIWRTKEPQWWNTARDDVTLSLLRMWFTFAGACGRVNTPPPPSFFFSLSLFLSQTAHAQAHCTKCYYHNLPSAGHNLGVLQVSFRRSSPARNLDSTLKICAIIVKIKKIVFTNTGLEINNWVVSNLSLIVSGDDIVISSPLPFCFVFDCVSLYSALNINVIE